MGLYLTEKHIKYKKTGGGDYVSPFFIYHKNKKRTKVFCSLKINQKDWNFKAKEVKKGDVNYKAKNNKINSLKKRIEKVINHYDSLDEILTPDKLKIELEISKIISNGTKSVRTNSKLNSKVPVGPLSEKWKTHKGNINLVSPSNKRNIDIIVIGTGLAGASASATLAELGYNVKAFCFQDSPRRAHSIAAQGGINAAKNYQGDGDSIYRLF